VALPTRRELATATEHLGKRQDLEWLLDVERSELPRAKWHHFCAGYSIDNMDMHAMKLMPSVVPRLREIGITENLPRLEGICRYLWLQTEVMARGAEAAAALLTKKGVRTVAIKGLALRRLGIRTRPMVDADLVVEVGDEPFSEASRLLRESGWTPRAYGAHATTFSKDRAALDLHHVTVRQDPRFDALEWSSEGPAGSYRHLDATGELIVTVLHGMRSDGGGLWVLDVDFLARLRSINWPTVVYYARTRALVLTFAAALKRVPSVPTSVIAELEEAPASHLEALELRHLTEPRDRVGAEAARTLATMLRANMPIVTAEDLRPLERRPGFAWDPRWVKEWSG
jgi:hypothetical protein